MMFETIVFWAVLICQPSPTEKCTLWAANCLLQEMEIRSPDDAFEQCAETYNPEDFGFSRRRN